MTVDKYLDEHLNLLKNRHIRLLDRDTCVGYTDKMIAYLNYEVKCAKITNNFVILFI
jgi:hypothetical protein